MGQNRNRRRTKKASLQKRIRCLANFLASPNPFRVEKKYLKGEEPQKSK
jgi:hypothetical protein